MNFIRRQSEVKNYLSIFLGTAFMAVAIHSIYDPAQLVTGGVSGLAIVIKFITEFLMPGGIPLGLTNIILNIPLFLVGIRIKGFAFLKKTIFGTFMLSGWLYILPVFSLISGDMLLISLFGGVILGFGMGLVFLGHGTTGGTDMAAALIQHKIKHYSIARIMQMIDGLIVLLGVFVFGIDRALYAVISIVVSTKITDGLIEGMKFSKIAYIITDQYEDVARTILTDIQRGLTGISIKGMYTNKSKTMLFCVVSRKQIVQLKEAIVKIDPDAFVIVSDAREVMGEGFLETDRNVEKV